MSRVWALNMGIGTRLHALGSLDPCLVYPIRSLADVATASFAARARPEKRRASGIVIASYYSYNYSYSYS